MRSVLAIMSLSCRACAAVSGILSAMAYHDGHVDAAMLLILWAIYLTVLASQLATARATEGTMPDSSVKLWRVGTKVPLNVYEGDRPVCQCHSEADAKRLVEALNLIAIFGNGIALESEEVQRLRSERGDVLAILDRCQSDLNEAMGVFVGLAKIGRYPEALIGRGWEWMAKTRDAAKELHAKLTKAEDEENAG